MSKQAEQDAQTEDEFVTEESTDLDTETEQTDDNTGEDEPGEGQSDEEEEAEPGDDSGEEEAEEISVSIGEEAPPADQYAKAPNWVKDLRKANREKEKRIRELEAKLNQTTEDKPVVLGKKPTLEDHDYDADQYEKSLADWFEKKRQVEAQAEQARQTEQQQKQAWQAKLDKYATAKAALKVRDFEDAESTVQEVFNVTQQGIVLQGADNPALVLYALGKNPTKAAAIAKITDPVEFAFAVAKLEKDLKVSNKKTTPPPERTVNGTGRTSGTVDSTLEKLRAEAEKTGNYTKVTRYKKQKAAAKG